MPPCSSTASSSASARSRTARAVSIAVSLAVGVVHRVEAELVGVDGVLPQLALEVAQGQVGEVVGALVGLDEVGRERGVDREAGELPAVRGQREARPLGVVDRLGRARGRPARPATAASSSATDLGDVDPGRLALAGRDGDGQHLTGARAPAALDGDADPRRPRARARRATRPPSPAARRSTVELEAGLGLDRRRRDRGRSCRAAGRAARRGTPARRGARGRRCGPTAGGRVSPGRTGRVRSRTSALSWRLRITSPRWARSASPFLPVISSARAMTLSRPSNWLIHFAA